MTADELAPGEPVSVGVTSAASARDHTRSVVDARWNDSALPAHERDVIDLLLVVSELVTNAIRHGGGLAGFEAAPAPDGVLLTVHDHSDVVPAGALGAAPFPVGHVGSGYGWPLIVRLSRDLAVEHRPSGGKTIRAFVPIRTVPSAPPADGARRPGPTLPA